MNETDLLVRRQLILKKIAELGGIYADDLRLGKKCALEHRNDLLLLKEILELTECYMVYNCNLPNCITETELKTLLDSVSEHYKIYFKPIGFYGDDNIRITPENCERITINGDERIYI